MDVDRNALAARYRDMSDEEILDLAGGGQLTDVALEVALAEISSRGLPMREPDEAPRIRPAPGALKVVGVYLHPVAAEALSVRLVAEGLDPVTQDANGGVFGPSGFAGIRVYVPESQLADAERIRAAMDAGDFAIDENFDPGQ
jgi:hypothetical protein